MADDRPIRDHVRAILAGLGQDPSREGLEKTPERVEKSLKFLTSGYATDCKTLLNEALFTVSYDEMVTIKDIECFSMCEHHLLPFFGKCHIAYMPSNKIVGLSKLPRLVNMFARRLQVQERLTAQVADCIAKHLQPKGVAVVIEASHSCMSARGVNTPGVMMTTSRMMGTFRSDERSRREVLALMGY